MKTSRTIVGDCVESMNAMPEASVHCVVTSPPYWGLRDYGTSTWEGGDEECDHRVVDFGDTCGKCGARRIDQQLGLESTPSEYLAKMLVVFRAVRRVMRDDASLWVNMGDCYASAGDRKHGGWNGESYDSGKKPQRVKGRAMGGPMDLVRSGLKPKNLVGMPWRLALALQADGWYLRSDIIWAKPNPMPESCTDRPTKSHEYVFLLTKRPTYYYDAEAVREGSVGTWNSTSMGKHPKMDSNTDEQNARLRYWGQGTFHPDVAQTGRNRRTVWTIATQAYADAHFATYPERLVEPCIMAGTSDKGCCPECGTPWMRVVVHGGQNPDRTTGWRPGCDCVEHYGPDPEDIDNYAEIPCTVLDPFVGSGTTGVVARKLGRSFIGCELNPEYARMAERRIANPHPEPAVPDVPGQRGLFDETPA